MKRALLLALLWAAPVWAQKTPRTFVIVTDPPGMRIYRWNREAPTSQQDDYLGESGKPLQCSIADRELADQWKLYFVYPRYDDGSARESMISLTPNDLVKGRYPAVGALYPPLNSRQRMDFLVRQYGMLALPFSALPIFLLVSWRRLRKQQRRALLPVPVSFDKYELHERLGSGAMADVYRGVSKSDKLECAIKVLRGDIEHDETTRKRFLREVQVCVSLRHPNIVEVYDWGEQDGKFFLVLELLRGQTLRDAMRDQPEPTHAWIMDHLRKLASALLFLHERGVVHRDVKPDNIFLCESGVLKLMDFGIARGADLTMATATGMTMGTPAYMAPEQVRGEFVAASDQYALGVLAFRLLTGRLPFDDDDPLVLAVKHLQESPPDPAALNPQLRPPVCGALLRMLRKQPEQRFPDIVQAVEALDHQPGDQEGTTGMSI